MCVQLPRRPRLPPSPSPMCLPVHPAAPTHLLAIVPETAGARSTVLRRSRRSSPTIGPPIASTFPVRPRSIVASCSLRTSAPLPPLHHLFTTPLLSHITGVPYYIKDEPLYPWRGVMIDTANHYLSTSLIKETIDLMSFHKFNVLHWHIMDSYSFPLEARCSTSPTHWNGYSCFRSWVLYHPPPLLSFSASLLCAQLQTA